VGLAGSKPCGTPTLPRGTRLQDPRFAAALHGGGPGSPPGPPHRGPTSIRGIRLKSGCAALYRRQRRRSRLSRAGPCASATAGGGRQFNPCGRSSTPNFCAGPVPWRGSSSDRSGDAGGPEQVPQRENRGPPVRDVWALAPRRGWDPGRWACSRIGQRDGAEQREVSIVPDSSFFDSE